MKTNSKSSRRTQSAGCSAAHVSPSKSTQTGKFHLSGRFEFWSPSFGKLTCISSCCGRYTTARRLCFGRRRTALRCRTRVKTTCRWVASPRTGLYSLSSSQSRIHSLYSEASLYATLYFSSRGGALYGIARLAILYYTMDSQVYI